MEAEKPGSGIGSDPLRARRGGGRFVGTDEVLGVFLLVMVLLLKTLVQILKGDLRHAVAVTESQTVRVGFENFTVPVDLSAGRPDLNSVCRARFHSTHEGKRKRQKRPGCERF